MRLLKLTSTGGFELMADVVDKELPRYGILSHTWGEDQDEVTFDDLCNGRGKDKPGYQKLEFCGQQVRKDGLEHFWVDSCCINKANLSETAEAIQSMFRWYQAAVKCYVYLSDVSSHKRSHDGSTQHTWEASFRTCRWFTRGWTLQELLAPTSVEFYSKERRYLGDKKLLGLLIHDITNIPTAALEGAPLSDFSEAERMQWAMKRQTKKTEDKWYSLLGIFGVFIPLIYGEKDNALERLKEAIAKRFQIRLDSMFKSTTGMTLPSPEPTAVNDMRNPNYRRREELLESLDFQSMDARRATIKSAYKTTCGWILKHSTYLDWMDPDKLPQHRGFLYISGKPGAGKSTLIKFMHAHVEREKAEGEIVLSYFFNARGDDLEKSTTGMYRALLFQLFSKVADLQWLLDDIKHNATTNLESIWTLDFLRDLFAAAISNVQQRRVKCFIDALDECDERQVQEMVDSFEELGEEAIESARQVHVCYASRHYPTILTRYGERMTLEEEGGHSDDLIKYVQKHLKIQERKPFEEISSKIYEKANGVFMWVVLVVDILNKEYSRGRIHNVRNRLNEIPPRLGDLFRDILTRDRTNMNDLLLCLQWILFACRPLVLQEFYYAMMAGLDSSPENIAEWDPEWRTTNMMKTFLLDSSKGLAEAYKSKNAMTVQFIHESVKDYLIKEGGLQELWPELGQDPSSTSHDQLKTCCQNYLTIDISGFVGSQDGRLPPAKEMKETRAILSAKFPFLRYANMHILQHANEAGKEISQAAFLDNFDVGMFIYVSNSIAQYNTRRYAEGHKLANILVEYDAAHLIKWQFPSQMSPGDWTRMCQRLFFAAVDSSHRDTAHALLQLLFGPTTEDIIRSLKFGKEVIQNPSSNSLVNWAIENDFMAVLEACFTLPGFLEVWPPLDSNIFRLVRKGHRSALDTLLRVNPACANVRGWNGLTLLAEAARINHTEIISLLLGVGANCSTVDDDGRNPLSYAAEGGHVEAVHLFLGKSRVVNELDTLVRTPSSYAAEHGQAQVVSPLLEQSSSLHNNIDSFGRTPLSYAAVNGRAMVVSLLLDMGAIIDSKSLSVRTPLSYAAKRGHAEVVSLLLGKGAALHDKDVSGKTPLIYAAEHGHAEVVSLLMGKGARLHGKDWTGRTPLMHAAEHGHAAVVGLLLGVSAIPNSKYLLGPTDGPCTAECWTTSLTFRLNGAFVNTSGSCMTKSLVFSINMGHVEVVRLLVQHGADVNLETPTEEPVLLLAIKTGNIEIVRLLVQNGADVNYKTSSEATALLYAIQGGNLETVRLLIQHGADVNYETFSGETVLLSAIQRGNLETVRLLIQHGANVNYKTSSGATALLYAIQGGNSEMVCLLIQHGADVNYKTSCGESVLLHATRYCELNVVRILLAEGATVNWVDKNGMTALAIAISQGRDDTEILLRANGATFEAPGISTSAILLHAAKMGLNTLVQYMLKNGADTEAQDSFGRTALIMAVAGGPFSSSLREQTIRMILDHGARIDARDSWGQTALIRAAFRGQTDIVDLLLERGANIEAVDFEGRSPLIRATSATIEDVDWHVWVCRLLLDRGASVEATDLKGRTALIAAACSGNTSIVRQLLGHKADIEAQDCAGQTALLHGADVGDVDTIRALLEHGANIEARDSYGNTALICASDGSEKYKAIECLLEHGSDINVANHIGRTALMCASLSNHRSTTRELLLKSGANESIRDVQGYTALELAQISQADIDQHPEEQ